MSAGYVVKRSSVKPSGILSGRRLPFSPFPNLEMDVEDGQRVVSTPMRRGWEASDELFTKVGLPAYVGASTLELPNPSLKAFGKRPVPAVFKRGQRAALLDAFRKWYPVLLSLVKQSPSFTTQKYDSRTKMGWPLFERVPNKLERLRPFMATVLSGDTSWLDAGFAIHNVRLQPERKEKKRTYAYVDRGEVKEVEVGGDARIDPVTGRLVSRIRLVFNYPVANLVNQVVDTVVHHTYLKYPLCKHNMAAMAHKPLPVPPEDWQSHVLAIDVRHFDHNVGEVIALRSEMIGGIYGATATKMLSLPHLVLGLDGGTYFVSPDRDSGFEFQFGSGFSSVAPIAKEVLISLYSEYCHQAFGVAGVSAVQMALGGVMGGLTVLNYGDDNFAYGQPSQLASLRSFLASYLPVEDEDPPKFLGFEYRGNEGFGLNRESYYTRWYLAERPPFSVFRPYPWLGHSLRREVYSTQGFLDVRPSFEEEDRSLTSLGYDLASIQVAAARERLAAARSGVDVETPERTLGKDYLLTEEQKEAMPFFNVLPIEETTQVYATLTKGGLLG